MIRLRLAVLALLAVAGTALADTVSITGTGVKWGPPAAPVPSAPAPTYGPVATTPPAGAIVVNPADAVASIVNAAAAGATIYFNPGVYRGVSLVPKAGQTFLGALGAILNGSAVLTGWTQSGSTWSVGGQTQRGTPHPNAWFLAGVVNRPESVFLDGKPLKAVGSAAQVAAGKFFFDLAASRITIGDNPAGHVLEATTQAYAFSGGAANVTIRNLVIEKYMPTIQHGPIDTTSASWTVRNNEIRWNYAAGVSAWAGATAIAGNFVHDNGQLAIAAQGTIEDNELAFNGAWSGIDPTWEAGGLKSSTTTGVAVRRNYVHDNTGSGIWADIGATGWTIENNLLVRNSVTGISYEISSGGLIRSNTLLANGGGDTRGWGWGAAINLQNSQATQVTGNRIDMTGGHNGIALVQQNRTDGTGAAGTTGNTIRDNILVESGGTTTRMVGGWADYNAAGMTGGGNVWANNKYFMADGPARFSWPGAMNFAGFKAAAKETGALAATAVDSGAWLADWRTLGTVN